MQNIESSHYLTVLWPGILSFIRSPKHSVAPKTFRFPQIHTPWPGPELEHYMPPALITPFLVSENHLWCAKVTNAQTFCLETSHSPFKPQQTRQVWWSPFGIYLHPNNPDLLVTLYTHSLPKNLPYNRTTFTEDAHLLPCKLLEIKNYVIYYHFYNLNQSAQSSHIVWGR